MIATVPEGPAITHADSSLVSVGQPATPGEVLTVYATDLLPELDSQAADEGPAESSPTGSLPISVFVGGSAARVLYAGRYPGTANGYQINFQLPENTPSGMAAMQNRFIPRPTAQLSVR
jgi:uncharacterized protein (TIGR03437 family)